MTGWKRHDRGDGGNRGDDPDHGDEIIELTRVAFIAEAIAIRQDLERIGIVATVFESDAGGWAPHYAIAEGHRVMIRAGDLSRARELLSEVGGQLAADPPPATEVRKHRRPHGDDAAPMGEPDA